MYSIVGKLCGGFGSIFATFSLIRVLRFYQGIDLYLHVWLYSTSILLCVLSIFFIKNHTIASLFMIIGAIIIIYYRILVIDIIFMFFGGLSLFSAPTDRKVEKFSYNRKAGIFGGLYSLLFGSYLIIVSLLLLNKYDNTNGSVSPESINLIIHGTIVIIAGSLGVAGGFITKNKKALAGYFMSIATFLIIGVCSYFTRFYFMLLVAIPMGVGAVRQLLLKESINTQD